MKKTAHTPVVSLTARTAKAEGAPAPVDESGPQPTMQLAKPMVALRLRARITWR